MVSTRRSGGAVDPIELSFNGKDLKKVIPIAEQRRLQEEEEAGTLSEELLLLEQEESDDESEVESGEDKDDEDEEEEEEVVPQKSRTTRRATRSNRATKPRKVTRASTVAKRKTPNSPTPRVAATKRRSAAAAAPKVSETKTTPVRSTRASTKPKFKTKKVIVPATKKVPTPSKKQPTPRKIDPTPSDKESTPSDKESTPSDKEPTPNEMEKSISSEDIPLLAKKETRGRPRKYPLGPNGKSVIPPPELKPGEVRKRRGRPRKLDMIVGEKRKLVVDEGILTSKRLKGNHLQATSISQSTSFESEDEVSQEKIPSMQGATIQPISSVIPPQQHPTTSPNMHKHNINHLLSSDVPPTPSSYPQAYDPRTPTVPPAVAYTQQVPPPSASSYESGYSPQYQQYPGQYPPPPPPPGPPGPPGPLPPQQQQQYIQQLPPFPYQQYSHALHPPYPLHGGPSMQGPRPISQHPIASGGLIPPPMSQRQPMPPPSHPSQEPNGRIPITSIISQKIDSKDLPSLLYEGDTTREDEDAEGEGDIGEEGDEGEGDLKNTKRRYRVDRENIKINKRIMSQDTEDVIKMFKKFDDEVLSHPEARKRLLLLGFETRKRYITTFKHYIRFCCRKKMDNFFVTGELMKEFYEEQYAMSTSSKPVIRLRKMDPAFSKLQEINYLVYHLESKEIPNRQIALEYLVYKELGKEPGDVGIPTPDELGARHSALLKGKRTRKSYKRDKHDDFAISIYAPQKGRRPNHGIDGGNQTLLVNPSVPRSSMEGEYRGQQHNQSYNPDVTPSTLVYPKKITKKNIEEIRRSFDQLCTEINTSLQKAVGVEPAFVSELSNKVNALLDKFDLQLNGPRPPQPPPPQTTSAGVPIYDLQSNIYTVYQIIDEWYNATPQQPSIAERLEKHGEEWIRDEFDYNIFIERRSVVEFVERLSKETKVDIWVIANDCDKYIRDKSILDEFISEIELDVDDLFKRIMRYRQRRG